MPPSWGRWGSRLPRRNPARRSGGGRGRPVTCLRAARPASVWTPMRLLLVLILANGLLPGLGEVAEAVVHYAVEGHLAHTDADHGDPCEEGHERGCGTTAHLCSCCPSLTFVASAAGIVLPAAAARSRLVLGGERVASLVAPAPPLRPPIAA